MHLGDAPSKQSIRAQMLGFYSALNTSILNEFELPKSMGLMQTISLRERHECTGTWGREAGISDIGQLPRLA